ncbi:MAG TPA: hypothetical protein VN203_26565 [Candidatus Acidoferrum sp.]|nr:hypothetical protein [Candidatus Acidoferrum sp.]
MSRIYDALKRAAEQDKQREAPLAPPTAEKAAALRQDALNVVSGDTAVAAPIWETAPPMLFLEPLREGLTPALAERTAAGEPSPVSAPETYREQVTKALRAKLALERRKIAKEGKYLFEGDWLTAEQIHGLRRRLTWKALGILFQLVLLFGFMSLMNLAFLWVLKFALPE